MKHEMTTKQIERFKQLLSEGLSKIFEACEVFAGCIDRDPSARGLFVTQCPEIPASAWAAFEMVGRKAMDGRLLWGGGHAQHSLRKLPVSLQRKCLDEGVEVASMDGTHRLVAVEELTKDEVGVVFFSGGIRTADQQRSFMARISGRSQAKAEDADYYLAGRVLVVSRPMRIPVATLRKLVGAK